LGTKLNARPPGAVSLIEEKFRRLKLPL